MLRSRMKKEIDKDALELISSLSHDKNIFYYDIMVDYAHVLNLLKNKIINTNDAKKIIKALLEIEKHGFGDLNGEDVHEAIERKVIEIAGESGKKMHTARSRNDEIATCLRLFARDNILNLMKNIIELRKAIINKAEEYIDTIMPGFTHLQYAQPTKLSHHLIAYHDMLERDFKRCLNAFERINLCPLGCAALASTSFPLDRSYVANLLGFDGVIDNCMDAVSSRDFIFDAVFAATSTMLSLSRIAEEIILWSSEFDFVEVPEEFASVSSIMPQKKNPDTLEIIRGKAGKIIGELTSSLAIYKGLPFAYNRDFQEINDILYESLIWAIKSVKVMKKLFPSLVFKKENLEKKATKNFSYATEIADELVKKGVPFREAHSIVGKFISNESELKKKLEKFGIILEDLKDAKKIVESRKNLGGTSKEEIIRMIENRKWKIKNDEKILKSTFERINSKIKNLYKEIEEVLCT